MKATVLVGGTFLLLISSLQCSLSNMGVAAQRNGLVTQDQCNEQTSCRPWEPVTGPYCARGNKISLRFFLDIPKEDRDNAIQPGDPGWRCGYNTGINTSQYVVFPFCPRVDTLQAFQLAGSNLSDGLSTGRVVGMYRDPEEGNWKFSNDRPYIRVFGMGTRQENEFPQRGASPGAAVIADVCPSNDKATAIVPLFVLNISMNGGKFQYYSDYPQPGGVGFMPTCFKDSQGNDVCQLDASMECIGDEGMKNCAQCYEDPDELSNATVRVWTSYYGTDRTGRQMRSGSNNPLNFRAYSGGSMYSSLSSSLDNVQEGEFQDPNLQERRRQFSTQSTRDDSSTSRHGWGDDAPHVFRPENDQIEHPSSSAASHASATKLRRHLDSLKAMMKDYP